MPHLHLHLKSAHLEHNEGGILHKMDPVVHLRVGDQEWTSSICENGGKNPEWHLQHFVIHNHLLPHKLHIKVLNAHGGLQGVHIAEAEVPLGLFYERGDIEEWIPLHFDGHDAGRIHFRSEMKH